MCRARTRNALVEKATSAGRRLSHPRPAARSLPSRALRCENSLPRDRGATTGMVFSSRLVRVPLGSIIIGSDQVSLFGGIACRLHGLAAGRISP